MSTELRFFWNGIKVGKGKLQLATYHGGPWVTLPDGVITIYGKKYRDFSPEVHTAFVVENDADMQTDYFTNDRIRVYPSHPLYPQVKAALQACDARWDKRRAA